LRDLIIWSLMSSKICHLNRVSVQACFDKCEAYFHPWLILWSTYLVHWQSARQTSTNTQCHPLQNTIIIIKIILKVMILVTAECFALKFALDWEPRIFLHLFSLTYCCASVVTNSWLVFSLSSKGFEKFTRITTVMIPDRQ